MIGYLNGVIVALEEGVCLCEVGTWTRHVTLLLWEVLQGGLGSISPGS